MKNKIITHALSLFLLTTPFLSLQAEQSGIKQTVELSQTHCSSAQTELKISVNRQNQLVFQVDYAGMSVIRESMLGINLDNILLGENVKIKNVQVDSPDQQTYSLEQITGQRFMLDVRAFPDGIAFRYRIPTTRSHCIFGEQTTFTFPSQTRTWYASGPFQYGWLQQYQDRLTDSITGQLLAPPASFLLPNGIYASLTEANLFNYHGAVMFGVAPNQIQYGYVENKGHLETGIITGLPPSKYWHEVVRNVPWIVAPKIGAEEIVTPWRVLMLAKDLNGLVNNKIISKVSNKPDPELFPKGSKTDWIKPGRSVFTWLVEGGVERLSIANHKKYVDGCAELGIESVVVDDGWELWPKTEKQADGRSKWEMLKELTDYAAARNVDIWVWRPSSPRAGNHTDVGLVEEDERNSFMKKCAKAGVKGLKIDFFHTENLFTVNLMENILKAAAREKLMVVFHGVNKPTGDSYTYPNLLAKEAVRGLECVGGETSWAPGPSWPYHNTTLPFTRWLAGAADYTPLNFRNFCPPQMTFASQLASIYLFTSPMLILAADMEDMLSCPGRSFIESVPVEWDETIVLPQSQIGKLAALARRKGEVWYVTVMNGDVERIFETKLDFLPKGRYNVEMAYDKPGNRKQIMIKNMKINCNTKLREPLMSGGAILLRINKMDK